MSDKKITESALQEARDIISRELFGHYDIDDLEVLKIEASLGREHDYGLVKAILRFSTKRNATKSSGLNPHMFEPGNVMCQGWLYLHCGVPIGHVFQGKLEVLLAVDRNGTWRAVSHTGAQEGGIRSMVTFCWKDAKRKGMSGSLVRSAFR